ncbi:MAG: hypothetical protein Kow0069_29040 [Promethearchaeota archaeon]
MAASLEALPGMIYSSASILARVTQAKCQRGEKRSGAEAGQGAREGTPPSTAAELIEFLTEVGQEFSVTLVTAEGASLTEVARVREGLARGEEFESLAVRLQSDVGGGSVDLRFSAPDRWTSYYSALPEVRADVEWDATDGRFRVRVSEERDDGGDVFIVDYWMRDDPRLVSSSSRGRPARPLVPSTSLSNLSLTRFSWAVARR